MLAIIEREFQEIEATNDWQARYLVHAAELRAGAAHAPAGGRRFSGRGALVGRRHCGVPECSAPARARGGASPVAGCREQRRFRHVRFIRPAWSGPGEGASSAVSMQWEVIPDDIHPAEARYLPWVPGSASETAAQRFLRHPLSAGSRLYRCLRLFGVCGRPARLSVRKKFDINPVTTLTELQNTQKTKIGTDTEMLVHPRSSFDSCQEQIDEGEHKSRSRHNDHSRVKLQNAENDYINASLVVIEEAQRYYILTQGPLPNTCCHFWLMVWQQQTKAVVMLNRIVEKESVKCEQYWPTKEDEVMIFSETGFRVRLVSEDVKSYYTVHLLQLENINSGESRMIFHFHYTTWPDFGVPESPASFLNFLFKVRESGSLSPEHGPAVIHCSAGIGRSGTFSLVDTFLVLMEKKDSPSVDIKKVLLDMRKYRMGLIQTPDQLRFSYMAVIEGGKLIKGDSTIQKRWKELSKEDQEPSSEQSPPHPTKITTEKYNGNSIGLENKNQMEKTNSDLSNKVQDITDGNTESTVRKRLRDDRKANTAQKLQQMKQKLNETERKRKRPRLTDT